MVPAKGVERWLTQRLSHRLGTGPRGGDGVCAGVRFLSPRSLVVAAARPRARRRRGTPTGWSGRCSRPSTPASTSRGAPPCRPTSATAATARPASCAATAATRWRIRLAGLFASYAVQRPPLVTDWREGRDTDGAGGPLDGDLPWQAELWRRLLTRVRRTRPTCGTGDTLERLRAGGDGLDLPARLSLFGHTRLPVTEVELLGALGQHRDVHLWLPQPSPALWDALAGLGGVGGPRRRHLRRPGRPPAARLARPRRPRAAPHACAPAASRRVTPPRRPAGRAGHAARLAPARPARQPRPDGPGARAPAARRGRPQPAGARLPRRRPARSTCCARCWSGCSRTTRPSSRATSS